MNAVRGRIESTELVVALDVAGLAQAQDVVQRLSGLPVVYKIGFELFLSAGPDWVKSLTDSGIRVFLDLKLHDIPHTVASALAQVSKLNVEFTTIHLSGGRSMLDAIEKKAQEVLLSGGLVRWPRVLGVSVLTSFSEEEWLSTAAFTSKLGSVRSIQDSVMNYAALAYDHSALFGMVCSPQEAESIRLKYPDLFLMVPGIRPEGVSHDDQSRVMTPKEARRIGCHAIVVGRPILQSSDPRKVAEHILGEIQ